MKKVTNVANIVTDFKIWSNGSILLRSKKQELFDCYREFTIPNLGKSNHAHEIATNIEAEFASQFCEVYEVDIANNHNLCAMARFVSSIFYKEFIFQLETRAIRAQVEKLRDEAKADYDKWLPKRLAGYKEAGAEYDAYKKVLDFINDKKDTQLATSR